MFMFGFTVQPHQEKLFNNLRRGDRGTPQRLAPRHCDARAEPPERSGGEDGAQARTTRDYPRDGSAAVSTRIT